MQFSKILTLFSFGFILSLPEPCLGQKSINLSSREIKSDQDLLNTTIWLHAFGNGVDALGTGYYFYSIKSDKLFIITNRHVVKDASFLEFNLTNPLGTYTLGNIQNYCTGFLGDTDLIVIRIDSIDGLDLNSYPSIRVFTEKNIITEKKSLQIDLFNDNIYIITYSGFSMLATDGVPFIIKGSLATIYSKNFQRFPEFCISADIKDGSSGSPIVLVEKSVINNNYYLLGTYYYSFGKAESIMNARDTILHLGTKEVIVKTGDFESDSLIYNMYYGVGIAIKSRVLLDLIEK